MQMTKIEPHEVLKDRIYCRRRRRRRRRRRQPRPEGSASVIPHLRGGFKWRNYLVQPSVLKFFRGEGAEAREDRRGKGGSQQPPPGAPQGGLGQNSTLPAKVLGGGL